MKRLLCTVSLCIIVLMTMALSATAVFADENGGACTGDCGSSTNGPALTMAESITLCGGYVAAGIGMRNLGYGTINISGIPGGSTVKKAYLYWTILNPVEITVFPSFPFATFNGNAIVGTLIGSDDDPCWGAGKSWSYRADVTPYVSGNGPYSVSDIDSGSTDGHDAWDDPSVLPYAEGASLVVIYCNPELPCTNVVIYDGNDELEGGDDMTNTLSGFKASSPVSGASVTFIGADGQSNASEDNYFNGNLLGDNPWDGSDPQAVPDYSLGNLWDTDTYGVTAYVSPGDTSATVTLEPGTDCLVWVATVFAVSTDQDWCWCDCHKMHYPQMPDLEYGMDIASSDLIPVRLADDFLCTATGPITDIHVWSSWLDDWVNPDAVFQITIYDNIPVGPGGYSIPGPPLWSRAFSPGEYSSFLYATWNSIEPELFVEPAYQNPPPYYSIIGFDSEIWQYDFYIPPGEAFIQNKGETYWLSVGETSGAPEFLWGWKTSRNHWQDAAVFIAASPGPVWVAMAPTDPQIDLSFVITSDTGTIIVEKQTDPNGADQEFEFTGDAAGIIKDDEQIVVNCLPVGTYTSQEIAPNGWALVDITVDDGGSTQPSTVDLGTRTVTFNLDPGEMVKATFFNACIPGPVPPPPSPPPTGGPVGITVMPMDKAGLLMPWLGLAGLLVLGTGAVIFARRRINREN